MYGVVTTVPAPVEIYDRMHAELIKRASSFVGDLGLLVAAGCATGDLRACQQSLPGEAGRPDAEAAKGSMLFATLRQAAAHDLKAENELARDGYNLFLQMVAKLLSEPGAAGSTTAIRYREAPTLVSR